MTKQPRRAATSPKVPASDTVVLQSVAESAAVPPDHASTMAALAANAGIDSTRRTVPDDVNPALTGDAGSHKRDVLPADTTVRAPKNRHAPAVENEREDEKDPKEGKEPEQDKEPPTDISSPLPPLSVDDPTLKLIREEIQRAIDLKPVDPKEFDFKVSTVKWFGILCAIVVLLLLILDFVFIDKIITASGPPAPQMNLGTVIGGQPPVGERLLQLGIENEALALRNKRTVGALYMRAYTQFLSITAGAILAMLGAIFVLARVDSRETRSEASLLEFRWLINTASPGILLAGLGVTLVGFVAHLSITEIRTTDLPVFSPIVAGAAGGSTLTSYLNSDTFQKQMKEDLGRSNPEE